MGGFPIHLQRIYLGHAFQMGPKRKLIQLVVVRSDVFQPMLDLQLPSLLNNREFNQLPAKKERKNIYLLPNIRLILI